MSTQDDLTHVVGQHPRREPPPAAAGACSWAPWSAAVLLVACARPDAGVVRNPPPDADDLVHATEVVRLGSAEGAGPESFGAVSFVVVDDRGRLHVGDDLAQEIRVFDPSGGFVRAYGGKGEGPGESERFSGMAFDPAGLAWVWDPPQQRFNVFDSAGGFVRTVQRRWPAFVVPWPGRFAPDGRLLDQGGELSGLDPERRVTQAFRQGTRLIWLDTSMARVDSTSTLWVDRTAFSGNFVVPFERGLVSAFEADGTMWSTHGATYRITRTGAQGDTLLAFSLDVPVVPVSAAERDSAVHALRLPPMIGQMDPALIPEAKPAIARLVSMSAGWVGAFPELGPDTGRLLDVFSPEGIHRARIDLGARLKLGQGAPVAHGGRLYGVTTDVFDVPYVVVLDLGIPELVARGRSDR